MYVGAQQEAEDLSLENTDEDIKGADDREQNDQYFVHVFSIVFARGFDLSSSLTDRSLSIV